MNNLSSAEKAAHEHQHENTSLAELAEKHGTTPHEIRAALHQQYPQTTSPLKQQVLDAYRDENRTTRSILKEFGISQDTLNRWTLEHGLRRQPRALKPDPQQQAALNDYQNPTLTITQAAHKHNINPATLRRWAQRYGVERPTQENPKRTALIHDYHNTRKKPNPPAISQLAKQHGVPESTARTWLENQPKPVHPHPTILAQSQVISAYKNTSHPIRHIAKKLGISMRTAWRYLEGIPAPAHRATRSRTRKPARQKPTPEEP